MRRSGFVRSILLAVVLLTVFPFAWGQIGISITVGSARFARL